MKIQLKRSNVLEGGKAKEPTAAQMEYGELAVNYNGSDPTIFLKDSNNQIIRISSLGLPDLGEGAEQPGTLDDRYVLNSGDTMTGALVLHADPVNDLEAATKQYVDNSIDAIDIPAATTVGQNPPANPDQGDLWWSTEDGNLYIYYQDADSSQWVASKPDYEAAISIDDLTDVDTSTAGRVPTDGQVLTWNNNDSYWMPMDLPSFVPTGSWSGIAEAT